MVLKSNIFENHIRELSKQYRFKIKRKFRYGVLDYQASAMRPAIFVGRSINTRQKYIAAMHEVGHLRTANKVWYPDRELFSNVLERETLAWVWALNNLRIDLATEERDWMAESLRSYLLLGHDRDAFISVAEGGLEKFGDEALITKRKPPLQWKLDKMPSANSPIWELAQVPSFQLRTLNTKPKGYLKIA